MLRSLLLKKSLAYANAALMVIIGLYVVISFVRLPSSRVEIPSVDVAVLDADAVTITEVRSAHEYEPIIRREIFGPRARVKPGAGPRPQSKPRPQQPKQQVVTTLPLKLVGTVVAQDDDPAGSAIIENQGARGKKTYFVGDEVMNGVILKTINRRMVVLDNQPANRLEELHLEESKANFRSVAQVRPRAAVIAERESLAARIRATRPAVEGANRIFSFNRDQLIAEVESQYDELAANVDVRLVKDANGNVQGVQASNISTTPLAQKFGLQEGDIVQSVNGQKIESLDMLYDLVERNQSETKFNVQLMRGGQKQIYTYHLN